jgi:hypothetical protein
VLLLKMLVAFRFAKGPDGRTTLSMGRGCVCWGCGHAGIPKNADACHKSEVTPVRAKPNQLTSVPYGLDPARNNSHMLLNSNECSFAFLGRNPATRRNSKKAQLKQININK